MILALFGVSFLTPVDAVFALAAAVPLATLLATERRSQRVRTALRLHGPGPRAFAPVAGALFLLPALVAVAAAQPVVVRQQLVRERGDAQAFIVIDTSESMRAAAGRGQPSRLIRAKRLALRLQAALGDVPVGLATMTDRVLPDVMPTTDPALFRRALVQSVGIDEPPPTQAYRRSRATDLQALVPVISSHFFSDSVKHRLLVVFTDGEASRDLELYALGIGQAIKPVFVHVWAPGERIYRRGRVDPYYVADPTSAALLTRAANLAGGTAIGEHDFHALLKVAHQRLGNGTDVSHVNAYARISLAPWFALGGILPLGFLFYRRNF
jgi:von Willebrand factor type A domain